MSHGITAVLCSVLSSPRAAGQLRRVRLAQLRAILSIRAAQAWKECQLSPKAVCCGLSQNGAGAGSKPGNQCEAVQESFSAERAWNCISHCWSVLVSLECCCSGQQPLGDTCVPAVGRTGPCSAVTRVRVVPALAPSTPPGAIPQVLLWPRAPRGSLCPCGTQGSGQEWLWLPGDILRSCCHTAGWAQGYLRAGPVLLSAGTLQLLCFTGALLCFELLRQFPRGVLTFSFC